MRPLPAITTQRLVLRTMSEEFLEASLDRDVAAAEERIGLSIPQEWFEDRAFLALRLADCRADPGYLPWSVRAIGHGAAGDMVGHLGFHSRPDPEYLREVAPRGVELGYTVFAAHRRQGYAEEAVRGLLGWALRAHPLSCFVVSIAPGNAASLQLARKLGFEKVSEHIDPVDGLEEVQVLRGRALRRLG